MVLGLVPEVVLARVQGAAGPVLALVLATTAVLVLGALMLALAMLPAVLAVAKATLRSIALVLTATLWLGVAVMLAGATVRLTDLAAALRMTRV